MEVDQSPNSPSLISSSGMDQSHSPSLMSGHHDSIKMEVDSDQENMNGTSTTWGSRNHESSSSNKSNEQQQKLDIPDKNSLFVVLSFLKKHNLKGTEDLLKREAGISDMDIVKASHIPHDSDVQSALSSYASDENPDEYSDAYNQLKNYIDSSLDAYKYEAGQILWPVFVHMYLELVYNEHETQAKTFFIRFSKMQETFYEKYLVSLGSIMKKDHLINSDHPFKPLSYCLTGGVAKSGDFKSLYVVRMSREAQSLLKRFLQDKRLKLVQNIISDRMLIEVYDGIPRGRAALHAIAGHLMGEAQKHENKVKVYYGLLREPDLQNVNVHLEEDDDDEGGTGGGGTNTNTTDGGDSTTPSKEGGGDKPTGSSKKKKSKKDWLQKSKKNDPNAPPITRMPLPDLRDIDKIEKAKALREASKRIVLSPEKLPSICHYTILNGDNLVTCIKWTDDGTLMGVGFSSSLIKLWSLTPQKLRKIKPAAELIEIDRESDDVMVRMMDDKTAETLRNLRGHSGPVFSMDFSPDKTALISSSEDCTIRLWSLQTWTCLVVYKGHLFPVWKVVFSPYCSYYFASVGHDRTARLWATDNYSPLRVFAGHYSDVTQVLFHPNSNYIATGSSDRSVRLWDCVTGNCARLMTGHKGTIQALCFSIDGRFLASSCSDSKVIVWDMANGGLLSYITAHKSPVYTIAFSREGNLLATAGQDCCVRLWDFVKMTEDVMGEEGACIPPDVKRISGDQFLIAEYFTKNTPIFQIHFTRRNVLLASGPFNTS